MTASLRASLERLRAALKRHAGTTEEELGFPVNLVYAADLRAVLDWVGEAYVILAGLHIAVEWELAPAIKTKIAELVAALPAPPSQEESST